MFSITQIPMKIVVEETVTQVEVEPAEMYPLIISRIKECLEGANPSELLASSERGGSARADVLMNNARSIPAQAWEDALLPRSEFTALRYFTFVEVNGSAKVELLDLLDPTTRTQVERMIYRGYALEIALGWFSQALRLEYGAYDLKILRNEDFRL